MLMILYFLIHNCYTSRKNVKMIPIFKMKHMTSNCMLLIKKFAEVQTFFFYYHFVFQLSQASWLLIWVEIGYKK